MNKIPAKENIEEDYPLPKSDPPPKAKPINKTRINEFAALLSSSVHLTAPPPPPTSSSSISIPKVPVVLIDRDEEQVKKHIDARYNERIDDRKNIQVKTANIKALFEEKISTANRTLSQSTDHLSETKGQHSTTSSSSHRKGPVSYPSAKRHSIISPVKVEAMPMINLATVKDVVIEDKPVRFLLLSNQILPRFLGLTED